MYDPDRYRNKAEVERWKGRDPIDALETALAAAGEPEGFMDRITDEVDAEIDQAVQVAEDAPFESVDTLLRHVTSEPGGTA